VIEPAGVRSSCAKRRSWPNREGGDRWDETKDRPLAVPQADCYRRSVKIEIQDEALNGLELTEPQALIDLAVGLFTEGRVTLGRAAHIARITQRDFQQELARRGISIHYDVADLHADLSTLAALRAK
jgi:predicted HTH domain antitoxin